MSSSIAFPQISALERYKLLSATVIPRPIALVTTIGIEGIPNAAPYSFFNAFSEDPPLVVLGLQRKPEGGAKDTARNIAETGYFVVNMVDETIGEAMNICAIDFPYGVSELEAAGLTLAPGEDVPVPRIAEAPFALECRRTATLAFSPTREIVLGEVLRLHARDGLLDESTMRIAADRYHPVGRLFGNGYARQHDRYEMVREGYDEWKARKG